MDIIERIAQSIEKNKSESPSARQLLDGLLQMILERATARQIPLLAALLVLAIGCEQQSTQRSYQSAPRQESTQSFREGIGTSIDDSGRVVAGPQRNELQMPATSPSISITSPRGGSYSNSLTLHWSAQGISNPDWKFAINKDGKHISMPSVRPSAAGSNTWTAKVSLSGFSAGSNYDIWVKDDSTGVDAHSSKFSID